MYNGVEAAAVKGTGLSGYVQRSRVNVTAAGRAGAPPLADDAAALAAQEGGSSINPLAERRAQVENDEMAHRLAAHRALRDVRLRVLLYREEREAAGVEAAAIERECGELYASLLTTAKHQLKTQQKAEMAKSAAKFAAAFNVKTASTQSSALRTADGGRAFDRAVQDEARQQNEEERRQRQEQQLVDHLKRIRREGEDGTSS